MLPILSICHTVENLFQLKNACYSEIRKYVEDGKEFLVEIMECSSRSEEENIFENLKESFELLRKEMEMFLIEDNDYFFAVASLAALRSKDPRTAVSHYNNEISLNHTNILILGWSLHC